MYLYKTSDCPACQRKKGVNILTRSRFSCNVARYIVKLLLVFVELHAKLAECDGTW